MIDILDLLKNFNDDSNVEKLDLKNECDYNKYNALIDKLENEIDNNSFLKVFIGKDVLDNLRNVGKQIHESYNVKEEVKDSKTEDNSFDNNENVFPSSKIENIDTKMQIHRLTQEYIDTMVKPYFEKNDEMTNKINNMYTQLFEFACWILNHK